VQYSPYILPLLIIAMISIVVILLIWWRQRAAGSKYLVWMMLAVAIWSLGYSLEQLAVALTAKLFWAQVQFLVIPSVPVLWLVFILHYTGYERYLSRRNLLLLFMLPGITTVLAWTNGLHGLIWSSASYSPNILFPTLYLTYGFWFWIHTCYTYLIMLGAMLLVLRVVNLSPKMYRGQAFAMLFGTVAPMLANLMFVIGASPLVHFDMTPFMFTLSGLAVIWGFYRYQLMNIIPIARESIIEVMDDGVIVLNQYNRIVDINPAVEKIISQPVEKAVGQLITDVIPDWNQMIARTVPVQPGYVEIELDGGRYFGLRISRLGGRSGEFSGQLIVLRDITEIRERNQQIQRAADALRDSEIKYRTLFEASNDAILVETEEGTILDCNQSACTLFGYTKTELVGLCVHELIPAEILESLPDITTEAVIAGGMFMETLTKKKDGQIFPARMSTQIATLDGKQVIIVYVRDITAQKRVEEQIRQHAAHSEVMARVSARLNAQLDLKTVMNAVCEEVVQALNLGGASVILYDDELRRAQVVAFGIDPNALISDSPDIALYQKTDIRAHLQAPLQRNGKPIGELNGYLIGEERTISDNESALFESLANLALQSIINARLFEDARRRLSQVQALHAIDMEITANMDLFVTLQVLLAHVLTQLEVDAAAVLLFNKDLTLLEYAAGSGFHSKSLERLMLNLNEKNAQWSASEQRIIHTPNLLETEIDFDQDTLLHPNKIISAYAIPLIAKGEVKGVLEIFREGSFTVDHEWSDFLNAFAALAAIAIDNAQLFNDLQNKNVELGLAYHATIEGWSRALDLRDKETEGHTQRVADLTYRMARWMGIRESELLQIYRGALLHDIGKMAIPDRILLKEGNLSDEEWEIMRMHPVYAYELLSPITYLCPALDIPYCHHERWDGTGYPRGLKGEDIPLPARIFSVIDVWDALLSDRPYRSDWSIEEACRYIRENTGSHFDPDIVDAFMTFLTVNGLMEESQDVS